VAATRIIVERRCPPRLGVHRRRSSPIDTSRAIFLQAGRLRYADVEVAGAEAI
jgi:hypothetical protein